LPGSGRAAHAPCSTLLRVGFTEPTGSPRPLVRSYRTVSPLPVRSLAVAPSAVCSLWHCPAGHPDWPLASTLPSGVPTFLDPFRFGADPCRHGPRPPGRSEVVLGPFVSASSSLMTLARPAMRLPLREGSCDLRSGSGLTANRKNLPNASELYPAFDVSSCSPQPALCNRPLLALPIHFHEEGD